MKKLSLNEMSKFSAGVPASEYCATLKMILENNVLPSIGHAIVAGEKWYEHCQGDPPPIRVEAGD